MQRLILVLLLSVVSANAGIIRFVTYPVRHPVRMLHKTGHVVKVVVW